MPPLTAMTKTSPLRATLTGPAAPHARSLRCRTEATAPVLPRDFQRIDGTAAGIFPEIIGVRRAEEAVTGPSHQARGGIDANRAGAKLPQEIGMTRTAQAALRNLVNPAGSAIEDNAEDAA